MKINIFSIGQNKNKNIFELEKEYLKRLSRFIKIEIKEFKQEQKLLQSLKEIKGYIIGLEERGKKYDTLKFSKLIESQMQNGCDLYFIIADADGFNKEVEKYFDALVSLSELTFPHEIARMLLCEQLYRGFTILNNHPYHK
ncbi:MAG: 23S rRNA (pseudouridine(1915)-N(3))-methyltransferase RlmH [Patescibacteria group bacterium]